jgi:hypothetical protein
LREDVAELKAAGRYLVQIAPSYGVTVSYLTNLNNLATVLSGNVHKLRRWDENGLELLVDRSMNVWGSGGAHATLFQESRRDRHRGFQSAAGPQPKGVCDMGCGDATFLEHLYFTIKTGAARGQALDTHPLIVVGADYNKVARRISKQKLRRARVPNCHVIHGGINRPAALAAAFKNLDLDIHDFFHVRSFLDHKRPYLPPPGYVRGTRTAWSSRAFACLGEEISADQLEENLVQHLRRWAPYIGRFGLLVMRLTYAASGIDCCQPGQNARNRLRSPGDDRHLRRRRRDHHSQPLRRANAGALK